MLNAQQFAESEPNDTIGAATVVAVGREIRGIIDLGDSDWFAFDLAALSDLRVTTGPGRVAQVGDTRIDLVDPITLQILATNDDFEPRAWYSEVTLGSVPPGRYLVRVRGFNPTTTGSYALDIVAAPPQTLVVQLPAAIADVEGPEDNDVRVNPTGATMAISNDREFLGNIAIGGGAAAWDLPFVGTEDYDVFSFTLPARSIVQVETVSGSPVPAVADTVLHLLDSGLQRIAVDDDGGAGALSRIDMELPAATYYVAVNSFNPADTGSYLLQLLAVTAPPAAVASFVEVGGGCGQPGVRLENRVVSTPQAIAIERPFLGSEFCVDVTGLPGNVPVLTAVSFAALVPPLDLQPLGAPGCTFDLGPHTLTIQLSEPGGGYTWCQQLPYNFLLLGVAVEMQAAALTGSGNPLGVVVTNRGTAVLGTRY